MCCLHMKPNVLRTCKVTLRMKPFQLLFYPALPPTYYTAINLYIVTFKLLQFIFLTLAWSPSNRVRKEAWVPVVPLTPRNLRSPRTRCRLWRSVIRSLIQRHALFPTVVSCAGLKVCVCMHAINLCRTLSLVNKTKVLWTQTRKHYWKWVKPRVGRFLYFSAKPASRWMQQASYKSRAEHTKVPSLKI